MHVCTIANSVVLRRERNESTLSLRWPRGSMEATLPLLIRSLQKEVDLPAFEPDPTRDSNKSSLGLNPAALPAPHQRSGYCCGERGTNRR